MEPIFRKLSGFILRFSNGFTSLMSYFFFSVSITFCVFMHGFWFYLFLHIDEVLSINLSANVFVFGDFNIHDKDWLVELIQLLNSYSFFISNDLTQMVNFPTRMPDCDPCSPALLDLFISSDTIVFALQWLSSIGKFWSCCCLRCHWLCSKLKMGSPFSLHSLWLFSCWLGQSS